MLKLFDKTCEDGALVVADLYVVAATVVAMVEIVGHLR